MENTGPKTASGSDFAMAWICCALGVAGLVAFALLLGLLGLEQLNEPGQLSAGVAWVVNGLCLLVFGLQHSGMARDGFKRWLTKVVPSHKERSIYVAASGIVLLALVYLWQPLPGEPLWRLPDWTVCVAALGGACTLLVLPRCEALALLGLPQIGGINGPTAPKRLHVTAAYRWVRHPLMACTIVFLWGWPVMPPTLALLSGGMTVYILLGIQLEERTLIAHFGNGYLDYRRRVPALIPWRWPASPAVFDEVSA